MSRELKMRLLALEFLVCFAPLLVLLFIGAYAVPVQIGMLFHGANTLPFLALVGGGVAGLAGLAMALREYGRERGPIQNRMAIKVCAAAGFLALISFGHLFMHDDMTALELIVIVPPLSCTMHLVYVLRDIVFA